MRKQVQYLSQSLTSSTKEEMLLLEVLSEDKVHYYFVEYLTNIPPCPNTISNKTKGVTELDHYVYIELCEAFLMYEECKKVSPFLHAPTFIIAYLASSSICLSELGILT